MAARMAPMVVEQCDDDSDVSSTTSEDGRRVVRICHKRIAGNAVGRLRGARAAIAGNDQISAETRAEILAKLDGEIARLEAQK